MKIKGWLQSMIGTNYNLVIEIFLPNPHAKCTPSPFTEASGKLCVPSTAVRVGLTRKFRFYGEILASETICEHNFNTLISFTLVRVKN